MTNQQTRQDTSQETRWDILSWDSNFFGVCVARIYATNLDQDKLAELIHGLKRRSVRLVYWNPSSIPNYDLADFGGVLVDEKTVYCIKPRQTEKTLTSFRNSFPIKLCSPDVERLGIACGKFSRFNIDPNITDEQFKNLYRTWIIRSVSKELALEVLGINDKKQLAGLITLGRKGTRGDIGLVGVGEDFRGNRYGEHLVNAAIHWFSDQGFEEVQVVTQGANNPACHLYEKCGFFKESKTPYYHFWL